MSYEEGWSADFCLSCDNQTSEGAYCSQACRLADLDKAQFTISEVPSSPASPQRSSMLSSSMPTGTFGFYLPPAYDFTSSKKVYRTSPPSPSPSQEPSSAFPSDQGQSWSFVSDSRRKILRTSSSRSSVSLDSNGSNSAVASSPYSTQLSNDARQQLERYDNSFDLTRHQKHRSFS